MRWRSGAVALAAGACLLGGGCGGDRSPVGTSTVAVTPSDYVDQVQRLLVPPARLATLASARVRRVPGSQAPTRAEVDALIDRARDELERFRALRIDYDALRRQRDTLAGAYQATVANMERVGVALVQDDRDALTRNLPTLLNSMRGLSSAVSPPSSSSP